MDVLKGIGVYFATPAVITGLVMWFLRKVILEWLGLVSKRELEKLRSQLAKELEEFKADLNIAARQREIGQQVVDLIVRYKAIDTSNEEELRSFEADYYKVVPWIQSDVLDSLNRLFDKNAVVKPDPKDILIEVRRAILGDKAGGLTGKKLVHIVGYRAGERSGGK